jgi:hypothetical protein
MTCRWHELRDAVKASNLPASDKAVYRARLDHSDYGTAEMAARWTRSQQAVARETSLTVRQVRRAERHLQLHGWLKVSGTTGPGKTRHYEFAAGWPCDCTGRRHERTADTETANGGPHVLRTTDTNGGHAAGQTANHPERQREGGNGRFPLQDQPQRTCAKCGEQPAGPGRILCPQCKTRMEAERWPLVAAIYEAER